MKTAKANGLPRGYYPEILLYDLSGIDARQHPEELDELISRSEFVHDQGTDKLLFKAARRKTALAFSKSEPFSL